MFLRYCCTVCGAGNALLEWKVFDISIGYRNKDVTPVRYQWSYVFLALTYRNRIGYTIWSFNPKAS